MIAGRLRKHRHLRRPYRPWLLAAALLLLLPAAAAAVPPGDFLSLFPENGQQSRVFFLLQGDRQENRFAEQKDRRPQVDARDEERHYSEIRQSEAVFSQAGVKTGIAYKNLPLVYLSAGYGEASVDFSFTDELTPQKRSYSNNVTFNSEEFPIFGGGIAFRFFRKPVLDGRHLSGGMDLQYRYLDFHADKGALKYESTLHEIQLSLAVCLEHVKWEAFSLIPLEFAPYTGAKIVHFIGRETFYDPENTYSEDEIPDPIFYRGNLDPGNHVSLFTGVSLHITPTLLMTLETRFGDDYGYAVQLGTTF